jgi:hypothetical protein
MRNFFYIFISMIFAFSFVAGCETFPDYGGIVLQDENVRVKVEFGEKDRRLIRQHYEGKHKKYKKQKKYKKTPPGLAKKKKLPPGLQKQLVKRGKLPPGLQGRGLPHDLKRQLSPLPRGYVHMKVGGDVIILNEKTRVVVDIVYGLD